MKITKLRGKTIKHQNINFFFLQFYIVTPNLFPFPHTPRKPIHNSVIHRLKKYRSFNGWQLAKMKKSIPDMSLP